MEKQVKIYNNLKDAEKAEKERISAMSFEQRMDEFGAIQERAWGQSWTESKIQKKVSFELLEWGR